MLLTGLAACAVTCARASRIDVPLAQAAPPVSPSASGVPPAASLSPAAGPGASAESASPAGPLASFHSALRALADGKRTEHVRVAWMGDSHTAADFYPAELRSALQERYGDGGPGFIYIGFRVYRHGGINYERSGRWSVEPRQPASRSPTDDGVFGLGGVRALPLAASSAVELSLRRGDAAERAGWEVSYRLDAATSRFVVTWGRETRVVDTSVTPVGQIGRLGFETPADAKVSIGQAVAEPRIFGVTIERRGPGVVVDTLGINGARIDTPLAWNGEAWEEELRRRGPTLVVLAYGSNEVGDRVAPWRYSNSYAELLARARAAVPGISCAIMGLPDQATPEWTTPERVHEIETVQRQVASEQGCVFVSAFDAMGGEGSFKTWASEEPPLAAPDRIHLTPKGYQRIGAAVVEPLLLPPGGAAPASSSASPPAVP